MHQPPYATVSFGTESASLSKRQSLLCVCVCVYVRECRRNREREEKQEQEQGWKSGGELKKEVRTAIRNKCAARLWYEGDRCIIIG